MLLLASKSPRRRQLIAELGFPVRFVDIAADESVPEGTPVERMAEQIALSKAAAFDAALLEKDEILITADTIVAIDNQKLGKPHDRDEAFAMLRHLSARWHTVYTGVCLKKKDRQHSFTEATQVHFRPLTDSEITHYIETCRPYDKAGAYGIQEWIGMIGIDRIDGDYYNVMGLPLARLYQNLPL